MFRNLVIGCCPASLNHPCLPPLPEELFVPLSFREKNKVKLYHVSGLGRQTHATAPEGGFESYLNAYFRPEGNQAWLPSEEGSN
jgi:hypothetical protein